MTEIGEVSNGGETTIAKEQPYTVRVKVVGTSDILFHAWNCEAVATKASAKKGSEAKKSDDLESYVHRDDAGMVVTPTEYFRMAVVNAAKFRQDPRSARKSAMDLFKACVIGLDVASPIHSASGKEATRNWDYEHKCRVQIQRAGITRTRPAFKVGWSTEFHLMCTLPEYVSPADLHDALSSAGRLVGVGDFRPTYGRFRVVEFSEVA